MDSADRPVYNVGDNVPPSVLVLSILQHFFVLAVYMTYPVIITKAINGGEDLSTFLISATLIGSGIATILQAISRWFPTPPIFLHPCLLQPRGDFPSFTV